eukprot:m.136062 g.136062  ORF g.136062 m.136062 type:complete len:253 (-) comp13130_c0_seq8:4167-4925(-)
MRSVIRACGLASHLSWISSACLSSTVSSIPNNRLSQVFPQTWKGHRCASSTPLEYTQGQLVDKQREYFYFIDHNGFLFLDDTKMKNFTSQLKDRQFLDFFFRRVELNKTGRYEEYYPYLSRCGREMNFLNCDDTPFVFHTVRRRTAPAPRRRKLKKTGTNDNFQQNSSLLDCEWELVYAGNCTQVFSPDKITMDADTGRLYHPGIEGSCFDRPWLIASKLAREMCKDIQFGRTSSKFTWDGKTFDVDIKIDI